MYLSTTAHVNRNAAEYVWVTVLLQHFTIKNFSLSAHYIYLALFGFTRGSFEMVHGNYTKINVTGCESYRIYFWRSNYYITFSTYIVEPTIVWFSFNIYLYAWCTCTLQWKKIQLILAWTFFCCCADAKVFAKNWAETTANFSKKS